MKRVGVLLALLCALFVPSVARAEGLDSFTRGLNDFAGNGVNEKVTPEQDFVEEYEPVLREPETRAEGDEEPTTVGLLQQFVSGGLRFNWNGTMIGVYSPAAPRQIFTIIVPIAVLFVFFWWGVRKSLRMIMSAFRKGRQSV